LGGFVAESVAAIAIAITVTAITAATAVIIVDHYQHFLLKYG